MNIPLETLCKEIPLDTIISEIKLLIQLSDNEYSSPKITKEKDKILIQTTTLLAGQHIWYMYYLDLKQQYTDIIQIISDAIVHKQPENLCTLSDQHIITLNNNKHIINPKVFTTLKQQLELCYIEK